MHTATIVRSLVVPANGPALHFDAPLQWARQRALDQETQPTVQQGHVLVPLASSTASSSSVLRGLGNWKLRLIQFNKMETSRPSEATSQDHVPLLQRLARFV